MRYALTYLLATITTSCWWAWGVFSPMDKQSDINLLLLPAIVGSIITIVASIAYVTQYEN